jgi:hypothetical protein
MQAGESSLALLPLFIPPGEADLEVAAAKPKEDGCCSRRLLCLGGAYFKKALVTSGFLTFARGTLVKKTLGGMLVKKLLASSSLLSLTSGFLVKKALRTCRLCGQPPGICWRHACQGGVAGERPPAVCEQLACQDGIGGPPSEDDGAHPPTWH